MPGARRNPRDEWPFRILRGISKHKAGSNDGALDGYMAKLTATLCFRSHQGGYGLIRALGGLLDLSRNRRGEGEIHTRAVRFSR